MKLKKKVEKNNIEIKLLYLWKKIRDSRIRTKLLVYLVFTVLISGCTIGGVSYMNMYSSLIENAQESVISFLKNAGIRLDEQIKEFQVSAYGLSKEREITELTENGISENLWEHTIREQEMADSLYRYNDLYQYAAFVLINTEEKEVYTYQSAEVSPRLTKEEKQRIIERCEEAVSISSPAAWVTVAGRNCFVLKITKMERGQGARDSGTLIFGVRDSFFAVGDDSNPFFHNENIIIADRKGKIYTNQNPYVTESDVKMYVSYNNGDYYVYSTQAELNNENYLIVPLRTQKQQLNLICVIPDSLILERTNDVMWAVLLVSVILLIGGIILAYLMYGMIRKNLDLIETGMKQYEKGDYSRLSSPVCYDELGMLILQFNRMGMEIKRLNDLARKEEEEKQNLRYQVMETQINPHFLYNTLGTLKWMAYEKEEVEIAKTAGALINLLQFTVKNVNKMIFLKEEISYIQDYVLIQKTRYEDAFKAEYDVSEDAARFSIICFILQPFVENSILHGLDIARQDGVIRIKGKIAEEKLHLSIEDNGIGMPSEKIRELEEKIQHNKLEEYKGFNGLGVANIILRLKMVYGTEFQYKIESESGTGTKITLIIPKEGADR